MIKGVVKDIYAAMHVTNNMEEKSQLRIVMQFLTVLNTLPIVYGLAAFPAVQALLAGDGYWSVILLATMLLTYLFVGWRMPRPTNPQARWDERQGLWCGLLLGLVWIGELLSGKVENMATLSNFRTQHYAAYQATAWLLQVWPCCLSFWLAHLAPCTAGEYRMACESGYGVG